MWLYPIPAIVSLALWIYIFCTGPTEGIIFAFGFFATAIAAYDLFVRRTEDGDLTTPAGSS